VGPNRWNLGRAVRGGRDVRGAVRLGHRGSVPVILKSVMTFDGLTLAAIAAELNDRLAGGRVQKVVQPDPVTVALEVYTNHQRPWLLLSADPPRPRIYLTVDKPGRGVDSPTPLLLLLRKH